MKNKDLKEKCIISLVLVLLMGFILFSTYEESEACEYEGIIRLHVIANSDSVEDQALKLKVRDEIIKEASKLKFNEDIQETRAYLMSHLKDMEAIAEKVIQQNGYDYDVSANLGVRWIPEKTYGDMHFPAGNYEALNITIGEGAGQNWWCVLFPPLCLITEDEDALDEMGIDSQEQIKVKSKLMEILKSAD